MAEGQTLVSMERALSRIDERLDGEDAIPVGDLRAMKDELLRFIAAEPSAQAHFSPRIARLNLRLRELAEAGDAAAVAGLRTRDPASKDAERGGFYGQFYAAAERLLDGAAFSMLCREAEARESERRAAKPQPRPAPFRPAPLRMAAPPRNQLIPRPARANELASSAAGRPIKFDPSQLFREFGRERVLAAWGACAPENRPETAAAFRALLLLGEAAS